MGVTVADFLRSLEFRCLCDEGVHGRRITHPECPTHEPERFRLMCDSILHYSPSGAPKLRESVRLSDGTVVPAGTVVYLMGNAEGKKEQV